MRHGKSDWASASISDFDRPLNSRGIHDVKRMGNYIIKNNLVPDLLISSPAFRAISTTRLVSENFLKANKKFQEIQTCKDFYSMGFNEYVERIRQVDDSIETVMIVGHNPKLEDLVDYLISENSITSESIVMKTATIVVASFQDSWSTLDRQILNLENYVTPKKLEVK